MFPPKSPFRALFGAFYPHPAHQSALRAEGATHFLAPGQRGCSTVPLATVLPPPAPRPTPGPAGSGRAQTLPLAYCMQPTAELTKVEQGPISTSGASHIQYVTEPGDSYGKINPFLPHSPPPNRRPFSRGRKRSTPVAPSLRPGWPSAGSASSASLVAQQLRDAFLSTLHCCFVWRLHCLSQDRFKTGRNAELNGYGTSY